MNEITKRIEELKSEIYRIEGEIRELEHKNSDYYIGVYSCDECGDYEHYYRQLGFISEAEAKEWADRQLEDTYADRAEYFVVTKEIYDKYYDWYCLDQLRKGINTYNQAIRNLEGIASVEKAVDKAINDIAKELKISNLTYEHPVWV